MNQIKELQTTNQQQIKGILEAQSAQQMTELEMHKQHLQHQTEMAQLRNDIEAEFKQKFQEVVDQIAGEQFEMVATLQSKMAVLRKQREEAERASEVMTIRLDQCLAELHEIKQDRDDLRLEIHGMVRRDAPVSEAECQVHILGIDVGAQVEVSSAAFGQQVDFCTEQFESKLASA